MGPSTMLDERFRKPCTTRRRPTTKRQGIAVPVLPTYLACPDGPRRRRARQAMAALLHDAAEDQGGRERLEDVRRRFGATVARSSRCTDSMGHAEGCRGRRKKAYVEHATPLAPDEPASAADKVHNAYAILRDLRTPARTCGTLQGAARRASSGAPARSCTRSRTSGERPLVDQLIRIVSYGTGNGDIDTHAVSGAGASCHVPGAK